MIENKRLTEMVACAGCAGKLDADLVVRILQGVPQFNNPNVLVGYETADDAGIFRLDNDQALVQTLDFFTPIVDDPFLYGAIAAANSMSDVYAMGGKPMTAMAIACFPEREIDIETLSQIMRGGAEKLHEAGVALIGGHSVADKEIKFGYSITGLIHPAHIVTNASARPGDVLVLTKPLGLGIITSGIKFKKTSSGAAQEAITVMTTLNRAASEAMLRHSCHAATDVTGNGLLGHAFEMAQGSGQTLRFNASSIPFIPEAYTLTEAGILPGRAAKTWRMIKNHTVVSAGVSKALLNIMLDPQTSGGLLIAVDKRDLAALLEDLRLNQVHAMEIGVVEESQNPQILVD